MKVALSFPGCHRRGGVERIIFECANFLQSRGHETHVYASEWDEAGLRPEIHRHKVGGIGRSSPLGLFTFGRQCTRRFKSDGASDVLGAFGVQSPPGGVLWVQSVHRAWLEISRRNRRLGGRIKQWCNPFHPSVLFLERRYFGGRMYKKLIALTERVKADLMRFYDVPGEDIEIIPNGFAPAEFNLERAGGLREPVRRELGYRAADRVVVFAANEFERKGFHPLLRAISMLDDPSIRLLAVGRLNPGSYAGRIAELGLADRVKFTGPSSDVARYYAAADVFALPTQYEAWGLVIVEAMACGLPVLTSRLAGAAIAVNEGRSGYLLDDPCSVEEVAAKLRLLLDARHSERTWIAESVGAYAWPRVLLEYERVLQQCASGGAAA